MDKQKIQHVLGLNGYEQSQDGILVSKIGMRAVFSERVVKIECKSTRRKRLSWVTVARSFYGKVGETSDTIRIGCMVFRKQL